MPGGFPIFYTVYEITNTLNGKVYVGKHQTENLDDGYMGSGKCLKHSINKYGEENFMKKILYVFETEGEMNLKESELVTEEFCSRDDNYNLCPGGQGGWGYINKMVGSGEMTRDPIPGYTAAKDKLTVPRKHTSRTKSKISESIMMVRASGKMQHWSGRKHSAETIEKMKSSHANKHQGSKNGNYRKNWFTNGVDNVLSFVDNAPNGWYKGRSK